MEKRVYQRALEKPDALAVVDGTHQLTYGGLIAESARLATVLLKLDVAREEPIAILLGTGIKQIVSQVAVLFAGCTCVPIDPSAPPMRITSMLHDVNVRHILLEEHGPYNSEEFNTVHIDDIGKQRTLEQHQVFRLRTEHVERSHILFTSGSTGTPKPVQISTWSIIHLATETPATPLLPTDRVSEFNNPGFDLSLFEIWVTLLSGATVVHVPKTIATDPMTLQSFLDDQRISVMIIPTALFEIVASALPSAFNSLRHVLVGGDVVNRLAMRSVLESGAPEHLWNLYGPTESTTFATLMEVTRQETFRDRIGIGHPVGEMQIYLLDEDLRPIYEKGTRGEICITGPQLSSGYLNLPSENAEKFIKLKQCDLGTENNGSETTHDVRLYRTGDVAEWRPDGNGLDFIGRIDNQVKHGGFRIELEEIEKTLLDSDLLKLAAVVRRPSSHPGVIASLVAFVAPKNGIEFDSKELSQLVRQRLPSYMVPETIESLAEFPITRHGKIDRKALLERSIRLCRDHLEEPPHQNGGHVDKQSMMKSIWKDILNVSSISAEDDFFSLGASSLQAASMIANIRQRFGRLVLMRDLYENRQLADMVKLIDKPNESTYTPDDPVEWMKDIDLVDEIEDVPDWLSEDEGRVFITGVTGFVGAFCLEHLLKNPRVKQVACLARGSGSLSPSQRIQKTMKKYDLWPAEFGLTDKILVTEGDITKTDLGLGREKFGWLANWASVIFHLAARVNYCDSYREHHAANVLGTRNMLRLAVTGRRKSFHYMSSIDVWGPTGFFLGTRAVLEDDPLQPHVQGLRFDTGYAQSQWTAEGMVRRMGDRGLPAIIYRPGFITGHSETGASNPNDFVSRLIAGCIQIGAFPKLTKRFEYVTVDYVVEAVMHIASSRRNLGRSFSLLSPQIDASVSLNETCVLLNQAGYKVASVDYPSWVAQLVEKQQHHEPLAPLMPMLEEKVLGKLTRWEAHQYPPFFDSSNTVKALVGREDIQYKPLDIEILKRMIGFWDRKGFYKLRNCLLRDVKCDI